MRRIAVCFAIVLAAMTTMVSPAHAGRVWCKVDPLVMLDGTIVDISAAIPLEYVPLVNGPVRYVVTTPVGVSRHVILNDLGYNGYGSRVVFANSNDVAEDGELPIRVKVTVPIDTSRVPAGEVVPAQLSIIVEDLTLITVEGTHANTATNVDVEGLLDSLLNGLLD